MTTADNRLSTAAQEGPSGKFTAVNAECHPAEILTLRDITRYFPVTGGLFGKEAGRLNVLNGVTLSIREGETFGLVGESGCGKSTLARLIVKLIEPSSGSIHIDGLSLAQIARRDRRRFYRQVQMVFQDPYSSLNPRMRVRDILGEMLRIHGIPRDKEEKEVHRTIEDVGLGEDALRKYPFEFSGGQRQRIAIARAIIVKPRLLIADEPVSALDLSIRSHILSLLEELKEKYNLTILFISHDLETVGSFCDRVAVMYLGRICEVLDAVNLFNSGLHPYLKVLLDSVPVADPALRRKRSRTIRGEPPSPLAIPSGCFFHTRCPIAEPVCAAQAPPLTERGSPGHMVSCHRV